MRREMLGGSAMIAGAIMGLVTMALHPTGRDVVRDVGGQGALNFGVHSLALAGVPVVFYGAFVLTRRRSQGGAFAEWRSRSTAHPRWPR